ncbi:general stress protein [Aspergillus saccharolyticus JOP 1030-1]|uniref:Uncharacterized protein n=1 Tax=Aspergillus saccharolyticus JOP 1030-1 TaxID=1450539 RepID=A0A318ZMI3_9EURO|nr:hypothetical protein BP01DRAFT_380444 [Aspergillus saccharolyticus JOP 1030-1]PYH47885.1 hypothetical protein BP01DRAFT_380444 [Aspergillus saccharolyticus JOP 1030-1]
MTTSRPQGTIPPPAYTNRSRVIVSIDWLEGLVIPFYWKSAMGSEVERAEFILQRHFASMGGHASRGSFQPGETRAREAGRKGGLHSGGNFEPNDERARAAGRILPISNR